jgi:uncharacterized protein YbjT (DUF2867 family)
MHYVHLKTPAMKRLERTEDMTKILVTGATGNVSRQVADILLERGASVRAGVRDPRRAADLAARGAEVVRYDHDDESTLDATYEGVERAFILVPFVPDFAELGARAVESAKKAGVHFVAKLSAAGADSTSDFWLAKNHGQSDRGVEDSGMAYTILRPSFFQDNVFTYAGDVIRATGTFYGAAGDQRVVFVSSKDVADVAATALLDPETHANQTYDLTGDEALTNDEVAGLLSEAAGRTITYTNVTLDRYAAMLRENGTQPLFVDAFCGLESIKANGWAATPSPHVERVLGRAPEPVTPTSSCATRNV